MGSIRVLSQVLGASGSSNVVYSASSTVIVYRCGYVDTSGGGYDVNFAIDSPTRAVLSLVGSEGSISDHGRVEAGTFVLTEGDDLVLNTGGVGDVYVSGVVYDF